MEPTTNPLLLEESVYKPTCYSYSNEKILGMFRVIKINSSNPLFLISPQLGGESLYFSNLDIDNITEEECFIIFAKYNPKALYQSHLTFLRQEKKNSYIEAQTKTRTVLQQVIFGDSEW